MISRAAVLRHQAQHHPGSGKYLQQFIFGTEDGLVGGLGLITGVSVATLSPPIVILSGIALMLTQAVSMGAGVYLSLKSQAEVVERYLEKEREEIRRTPDLEKAEVRKIYRGHGFRGKELEQLVQVVTSNRRAWLSVMMMGEYGLSGKGLESPAKATVVMSLSMMLGAFIPLVPYFLLSSWAALAVSLAATTAGLFVFGAVKTLFTRRSWAKSGLEMVLVGMAAALAGVLIGWIFSSLGSLPV